MLTHRSRRRAAGERNEISACAACSLWWATERRSTCWCGKCDYYYHLSICFLFDIFSMLISILTQLRKCMIMQQNKTEKTILLIIITQIYIPSYLSSNILYHSSHERISLFRSINCNTCAKHTENNSFVCVSSEEQSFQAIPAHRK